MKGEIYFKGGTGDLNKNCGTGYSYLFYESVKATKDNI